MHDYNEIKTPSIGFYKEKGSKFIAYSYPVYSKSEICKKIKETKKKENSAIHYCYAYVLNENKTVQKTNDDGEPSYSAGKPILGQILSKDLTNILIIVVRYFGGVKLGISGLIRSYKTAARIAISKAEIINKAVKEKYQLSFRYPEMNKVMKIVKAHNLKIIHTNFKIDCKLICTIEKSKENEAIQAFKKCYKTSIKKYKI